MPTNILLVAISLFFWGIGEGLFTYFQPVYLQQLGASSVTIGVIYGALGIAMTVAQAPAGYLADRIGNRPVMWASWFLGSASAIIMALAPSANLFIAGMLLYGLTSFVIAPMNAYITSVRENWSIERALTITAVAFNLGMIVGPKVGGMIATASGIKSIYPFSAGLFILSTIIILFAKKSAETESHAETQKHPKLLSNKKFFILLASIGITSFALYLPQPLTPNFLTNEAGISVNDLGTLGTIASLENVLIAMIFGGMKGPNGFLVGQILGMIYVLSFWKGQSVSVFAFGYLFMGGFRLMRLMGLAFARTFIKASETGTAYGLIETANGLAAFFAPTIAGFLYQQSPRGMYSFTFVLIGAVLIFNLFLRATVFNRQSKDLKNLDSLDLEKIE